MGWFSEEILGGDAPLDYIATIREEILGLHYECEEDLIITRDLLVEHADEIAAWCARQNNPVAYEVWGQLLVESGSRTLDTPDILSEPHRGLIFAAIDADLDQVAHQGWKDPSARRFALRELREHIEVLGTGKVVHLDALRRTQLRERVAEAMQFSMQGTTDPSVVQKAVARMLMDLEAGTDFDDWAHAASAIVAVGAALREALGQGLELRDAVQTARERVGA